MANEDNFERGREESVPLDMKPQKTTGPDRLNDIRVKRYNDKWEKNLSILKEKLDKAEGELKQLRNDTTSALEKSKKTLERSAQTLKRSEQILESCKQLRNNTKTNVTPDEVIQLKIENKEKSEIIGELKQEMVHKEDKIVKLNEEVMTLKEENATLKNQILYLWELIKTYLATQFTALAKNFYAFFNKSKESPNPNINEVMPSM